eukprot:m.7200 g.7200  ORF g.7200 m.7200 type:complete len:554 (-) comp3667_c0_seq1:568-2229(-)
MASFRLMQSRDLPGQTKRSTTPEEERRVRLEKGPSGFGFSIAGGDPSYSIDAYTPIVITNIKPDGPAGKNPDVHSGDQILEINGESSQGISHQEAVKKLVQCSDYAELVLAKLPTASDSAASSSIKGKTLLAQVDYEPVQMIYPFEGTNADELHVKEGDVIRVTGKGTDGWCLGICERTQQEGMFPGNYSMKLGPSSQMVDALTSELELLSPGIHRHAKIERAPSDSQQEVLYETLPDPLLTGVRIGPNGPEAVPLPAGATSTGTVYDESIDKEPGNTGMPSVINTPLPPVPKPNQAGEVIYMKTAEPTYDDVKFRDDASKPQVEKPDGDVYEMATHNRVDKLKIAPRVTFVGTVDDIYSKVQKSSIYTPINKVTSKYTQRTSEPTYDTPRDARIEDLYASVNARESDTLENAKAIADTLAADEGIYSTAKLINGSVPPPMPVRKYDKKLLPPTLQVELDDELYERLPFQDQTTSDLDKPPLPSSPRPEPSPDSKDSKLSKEDKRRQKQAEKARKEEEKARAKEEKAKLKESKIKKKSPRLMTRRNKNNNVPQ